MKDTEFLKNNLIAFKGIYDNKEVYENSLEAFKKAIKENYLIHLKLRLTKDNIIVVFSDASLTRMINLKDKINTLTYNELLFLAPYHVPTIDEALSLIGGKVPIIINPRSIDCKFYLQKELVKILTNYNGKFAIINSNAAIIKWFNKNAPDFIIGEIMSKGGRISKLSLANFFANFLITTDFKSMNIEDYSSYKIRKVKENNLVLGYIIDNKEEFESYKNLCDNVFITNKLKEKEIIINAYASGGVL